MRPANAPARTHVHTHVRKRNGQMAGAITGSILREVFNWSQCSTIWGWSDGWSAGWREALVSGRERLAERERRREGHVKVQRRDEAY